VFGRLVAAAQQGVGRQHGGREVRSTVERPAQFLQDDGLLHEREAGAAVLLGDRDADQAELRARLPPHRVVVAALGLHQLPNRRQRRLLDQEPPNRRAQFPLLGALRQPHVVLRPD
jgi:hypothetical protein